VRIFQNRNFSPVLVRNFACEGRAAVAHALPYWGGFGIVILSILCAMACSSPPRCHQVTARQG
jgi:hypothetical protein